MTFLADAASAVEIAGGIGGMFGRKNSTEQNMRLAMSAARRYGDKYGFNPLTALGIAGSAMGGGNSENGAMLASIDMLSDGLKSVDELNRSEKGQTLSRAELNDDLARIRFDQARSGVVEAPRSAVAGIGNGPSPLGGNTVKIAQSNGGGYVGASAIREAVLPVAGAVGGVGGGPLSGWMNDRPLAETDPLDTRRPVEAAPVKSGPGFMVVDNPLLEFPVYAPTLDGDEPLQWYDYPSLAIPAASYGAQYLYDRMPKWADSLRFGQADKPFEFRTSNPKKPKKKGPLAGLGF